MELSEAPSRSTKVVISIGISLLLVASLALLAAITTRHTSQTKLVRSGSATAATTPVSPGKASFSPASIPITHTGDYAWTSPTPVDVPFNAASYVWAYKILNGSANVINVHVQPFQDDASTTQWRVTLSFTVLSFTGNPQFSLESGTASAN